MEASTSLQACPGAHLLARFQGGVSLGGDSSSARWCASNPHRVGRGCKGREGPCSMGWVQGKGSAKAPSHGLDEVVSMKWSGGLGQERPPSRWGAGERRRLPCEWVSRDGDTPFDPWFGAGGEGRLQALRVVDRRYGLLALERAQCPKRATGWGMQRGRAAAPLPRWCYSTTHILRSA